MSPSVDAAEGLGALSWPRRTPRLRLRRATADDAARIAPWFHDPAEAPWMPSLPTGDAEFTATFERRRHLYVVAELQEDAQDPLGRKDHHTPHPRVAAYGKVEVGDGWAQAEVAEQARATEAEIGWTVAPDLRGQGVGTELAAALIEVARDLGVRRVTAVCFADHTASWRIMERIGMQREAHFRRDSLHRDRGWLDSYVYATLLDEPSRTSDENNRGSDAQ